VRSTGKRGHDDSIRLARMRKLLARGEGLFDPR